MRCALAVAVPHAPVLALVAPSRLNLIAQGKYIAISITNSLQTTLIALLLAFFIYDNPVAFFIIKWTAVLGCDAGTLFLVFAPKVFMVRRGRGPGPEPQVLRSMGGTVITQGGTLVPMATEVDPLAIEKYSGTRVKHVNEVNELEELRQENEELRDILRRLRDPSSRASAVSGSCSSPSSPSRASRPSKTTKPKGRYS